MGAAGLVKNGIKKVLPRPLYSKLKRNFLYGLQDVFDAVTGRRPDLVPPKRKIFVGGGEFVAVGDEMAGYFKVHGGIAPNQAILDIGSGIGRMARPLTAFLSAEAKYEGFDIDAEAVKWCTENISNRFPNFKFTWANIYNKNYNTQGTIRAGEFRFPYHDNQFDFAFATSVFTHMFPIDIQNYLQETARVLKPGGKCLLTYFLLNKESRRLLDEGQSKMPFAHTIEDILTTDPLVPEDAVCLKEGWLVKTYECYGLELQEPILYGSWSGRTRFLSFQDVVVASKKS